MCSSEYDCESGGGEKENRIPKLYEICQEAPHNKLPRDVISKKRPPHSVKCKSRATLSVILLALCISSFPCVLTNDRVSKAIKTFEFRRNHGGGDQRKDVAVEFAGECNNLFINFHFHTQKLS